MRGTVFFILVCFMILPLNIGLAQDNIYGDYIVAQADKVISLDLEGANLVDVLKMLSQQTGLNFVSTEVVKNRELTLYVDNVLLKDAMDIIFKANNLTYDFYPESNIFVVKEMGKPEIELETRIYPLKFARVASGRLEDEIASAAEEEGATSDSGTGEGEMDPNSIGGAVQKVLSSFGKITEDPLTNSLIVTDVPAQFPVIEKIISRLDIPVPKVMIEVEVLDVSKDLVDKMGVNWPEALVKFLPSGTKLTRFPFGGANPVDSNINAAGAGITDDNVFSDDWDFGNWSGTEFGPSILTVIGTELVFNFLKSDTTTKSIARPRILTLSNETAQIKIITDEAIGIVRTVSEDGTTEYTIDRAETGTTLEVTPQVDVNTGEITMFVQTAVKAAVASGFTTGDEAFITGTIRDPEERSARTVTRVKNGETLLIGGLIKNEVTDAETRVPLLSSIP